MKIYAGNLSYEVSSDDLKEAFSQFGEVSSADVIKDKFSGRSKGFGFVEMASKEEAQAAIEGLNEKELKGRAIKVNEARPRQDKPRGGRNFGGRGGRGGHGGYSGGGRSY
jgi:RNA recognition motif-containing protein